MLGPPGRREGLQKREDGGETNRAVGVVGIVPPWEGVDINKSLPVKICGEFGLNFGESLTYRNSEFGGK